MAYSPEVNALLALAAHIGARVTDVATPGVHSARSYHYQGLAVDLAEPKPSRNSPGLLRINLELARLVGPQCAELIYGGPGRVNLRNGRPFQYSASILRAHENHIHVAVERGFRWTAPVAAPPEVRPMYDPPFQIAGAVVASLNAPNGGAWVLTEVGAIYAFGCPDHDAPNRHPEYWNIPGQLAARLEPLGGGYTVVDNAGRRYDYPAS